MWRYREQLNYYEKVRRSIYEVLRDALERRLMKISLLDSYNSSPEQGAGYPFVDKKELRPKSKKMEKECPFFNTFLIIMCEDRVSQELKNHIRFFPENRVIKQNLRYLPEYTLYKQFHKNLRNFDSPAFLDLLEGLLDVDYALLIQQDPAIKRRNRYSLTHFHVKIDWPIADAAQDLAKWLRYIQNNLYENGDKEARNLQNKLFEYYGSHHSAGGRRTAGLIAAQLLRQLNCISTVYVSSAEARSIIKYSERGVSKFFLIQLNEEQVRALAESQKRATREIEAAYLYRHLGSHMAILEVAYAHTPYSRPPKDGKLRKLRPAYNWLRLRHELIHPRPEALDATPVFYNWVYAAD